MKNDRLEKIINGLKHCSMTGCGYCKECPYNGKNHCIQLLSYETISLLREQDTQIGKLRLILNTHYGKEVTEELK